MDSHFVCLAGPHYKPLWVEGLKGILFPEHSAQYPSFPASKEELERRGRKRAGVSSATLNPFSLLSSPLLSPLLSLPPYASLYLFMSLHSFSFLSPLSLPLSPLLLSNLAAWLELEWSCWLFGKDPGTFHLSSASPPLSRCVCERSTSLPALPYQNEAGRFPVEPQVNGQAGFTGFIDMWRDSSSLQKMASSEEMFINLSYQQMRGLWMTPMRSWVTICFSVPLTGRGKIPWDALMITVQCEIQPVSIDCQSNSYHM